MRAVLQRLSGRNRSLAVSCALFFILFYVYLWLRVDPRYLYHFFGYRRFPCFRLGWSFLMDFLTHPGGLVEYASAFLFQFFDPSWAAAGIITGVALLLFLATRAYLVAVSGIRLLALQLVPPILFLLLYNRYAHHLTTVLALLAALLGAIFYMRMAGRRMWLRVIAFVVLSAAVYYAAAGAYLLYAGLCGIFELLRRRRLLGACYLLGGAAVPYIGGSCVFLTSPADSYMRLLPFHAETESNGAMLALCLYLFFPVVCLGAALWRRLARTETLATEKTAVRSDQKPPQHTWKATLKWIFHSPVFLIIAVVPVYYSFESGGKAVLQIQYCARHGMWQQLLEKASDLSPTQQDFAVTCDIYRALHHTGRLPYEMFSYQQCLDSFLPPWGMLVETRVPPMVMMETSDLSIELGLVNKAEHLAYEVLALAGNRPAVLWRLAMINIVKEKTEAARVFLRLLAKDIVYGKVAREYLGGLRADPLLSRDAEVQRIRSVMIAGDYLIDRIPPETLLDQLLQKNSKNRMAFEYLMARYLLTGQLGKVALNIKRLDEFSYPDIPRHYEEAILLYAYMTGVRLPLHGRRISAATMERFRRFRQLIDRGELDSLAGEFWNSYFFYFHGLMYADATATTRIRGQ